MAQPQKIPARRLNQLKSMAQARIELGDATALEKEIPALIAASESTVESEGLKAEKRVAVELINAEGLTSEYVHRLDSEGLIDHTAHAANPSEPAKAYSAEPREDSATEDAVLHIYPLSDEHGDAAISANSSALRLLRDAIDRLLEDHGPLKSAGEVRVFAADGEGFDLSIEKREGPPHAALWEQLPEPYYVSRRRAREAGMDV